MEAAICVALGKIGTPEAAKLLTEISKQKFYRIASYPERVRKAAARALMAINS
jgi:HEAT repeat protein